MAHSKHRWCQAIQQHRGSSPWTRSYLPHSILIDRPGPAALQSLGTFLIKCRLLDTAQRQCHPAITHLSLATQRFPGRHTPGSPPAQPTISRCPAALTSTCRLPDSKFVHKQWPLQSQKVGSPCQSLIIHSILAFCWTLSGPFQLQVSCHNAGC